jgi:transcriptional regulator with XRE-family HTH domain
MNKLRDVLARNLRNLRKERRFSQEEVAHRAVISPEYVSLLERAAKSASVDVIERLAKALGVEPHHLLDKGFRVGRP